MSIPTTLIGHAAGINLNEPDAPFHHAPSDQALLGEMIALITAHSIHVFDVLWFRVHIEPFRRRRLHAVGQFKAFDPGFEFPIFSSLFDLMPI